MKWIDDDDFFKAMDENPSSVYVVQSYNGIEREKLALFSTKAKAKAWCDEQSEDITCVVCPFIIDEPDFGDTPKGKLS